MSKENYDGKGMLGNYQTSSTPFPNPEGVKTFPGYGATSSDLEKGFCSPDIRELPAYDKINYADRWTLPKGPDEDDAAGGLFGSDAMAEDYAFREIDRRSEGFVTRPRIPTDR